MNSIRRRRTSTTIVGKMVAGISVLLVLAAARIAVGQTPAGVRPLGMGEAFTAVANDANAAFWNPAGLPFVRRGEVTFMKAKLYGIGLTDNFLALVHPISGRTAFGLSVQVLDAGDTGLRFSRDVFQFSLSRLLIDELSIGVNVKYVVSDAGWEDLFSERGTGAGVDAGLLARPFVKRTGFLPDLQFGAMLRNIGGTDLRYNDGGSEEVFPPSVRIGAAWRPRAAIRASGFALFPALAADLDPDDRFHVGGELWWENDTRRVLGSLKRFAVRAGVQHDLHTDESLTFAFGASLHVGVVQIDYAHTALPTLPATDRFAFGLSFAPSSLFFSKMQLRRADAESRPLYPSLIRAYETGRRAGLVTVALVNPRNESISGNLSIRAAGPLYRARALTVTVPPKDTLLLPLNPAFITGRLQGAVEQIVPYRVVFTYGFGGGLIDSVHFDGEFRQFGKNAIIWDDFRKAAAFVTPRDPVVVALAREIQQKMPANLTVLQRAMWLFEGLRARGIRFMPDPLTPNWVKTAEGASYPEDTIQFPAELLLSIPAAGDCDDLTVLYSALLAASGIETALIDAPQHIFMMLNTQVPVTGGLTPPYDSNRFIRRDGMLWVPVEITEVATSFPRAWQRGADYFTALRRDAGSVNAIDLSEAWSAYPPLEALELPQGRSMTPTDLSRLETFVAAASDSLQVWRDGYLIERFGANRDTLSDPVQLNALGKACVSLGADSLRAAIHYFQRSYAGSGATAPLVNMGNVHFMSARPDSAQEFYDRALAAGDSSAGLHFNRAQLYLAVAKAADSGTAEEAAALAGFEAELQLLQSGADSDAPGLVMLGDSGRQAATRGTPDGLFSSIVGYIRSFFSDGAVREAQWDVWAGRGLGPGERYELAVEIETGERASLADSLFASGRIAGQPPERVRLRLPSRNLRLQMETQDLSGDGTLSRMQIVLINTSATNTLRDVRVMLRLPQDATMTFSSNPANLQNRSTDERIVPSVYAARKSGIETAGLQLHWPDSGGSAR